MKAVSLGRLGWRWWIIRIFCDKKRLMYLLYMYMDKRYMNKRHIDKRYMNLFITKSSFYHIFFLGTVELGPLS